MPARIASFLLLLGLCAIAVPAVSQEPSAAQREARVAAVLSRIRNSPPQLRMFFAAMPKGADLHVHAGGAVYAERFLDWAVKDGDCIQPQTRVLTQAPCADPAADLATFLRNGNSRDAVIDAMSMRGFVPGAETGHDHFFATFEKFSLPARDHAADVLADATRHAAHDRVSYLELMNTFGGDAFARAVAGLAFDGDAAKLRTQLFAHGFGDAVAEARKALDALDRARRANLGCSGPAPEPGCAVTVRYLMQVIRTLPPAVVFAQSLLGFELAHVEPRLVGLNFVAPEDDPIALRNYDMQMRMLDALSHLEPPANLTLHAGELTLGLVPLEDLRFHIRHAIEIAHAKRIGHGVDVTYETGAPGLLREMAHRHVLVEICLSSNDLILGVRGAEHPLLTYLRYGVPVALATDDEGVSRIDLTHEFERAESTYGFSYATFKRFARNSLEYGFAAGASLWADVATARPVAACAGDSVGRQPSAACRAFLTRSTKAQLEWNLERDLAAFEIKVRQF
jgi:adenosine deaminase